MRKMIGNNNRNAVIGVALCTVLAVTGCTGGQSAKPEAPAKSDTTSAPMNEKTTITMLLKYYSPEPPKALEALQQIEEYTNTKLDIVWAPNPSYDEKVNTTLASGNLPQVMLVAKEKADNIVSAVKAGAFWEVGPLLKDYPNLSKVVDQTRLYNASYEGKIYSLPSTRGKSEAALIYRKDWLDSLGMKVPQTLSELYDMAVAFTQKDPDKNGKNDTFGLVEYGNSLFNIVKTWHGAPNTYAVKDGKLVPEFMTDEYMAAMKYMKRLFDEKLINQDFPVTGQNQMLDYINKGKAGGYQGAYAQFSNGWLNPLAQANPNAKVDYINKIKTPQGEFRMPAGGGYNGVFMFPKSSVKTEAHLKRLLQFFDKLADDKMRTLIKLGIEGKHYKLENGKPVELNPQAFASEIIPLRWIMVADGITDRIAVGLTEIDRKITVGQTDNDIKFVSNPAFPFVSRLIVDDKIIEDARTKFIIGELDENGWKSAIQKWRTNRGDQLIAEFQKQYDNTMSNKK